MEYTRYINEYYPKSTEVGYNPNFKKNRVKELKEFKEVNLQIDGATSFRTVNVVKITKVKLTESEDGKGWNFNCKAVLRLLD